MYKMTEEEFEQAVADALDTIPQEFLDELDNVVILVQDEPGEELYSNIEGAFAQDAYCADDGGEILGFYDGCSLDERGDDYGAFGDYPDTITVFKGPHERLEGGREAILEEIRKTVVHEIGHFFGMDEDQIDEMGYA
ncbi:MAG: metallopeptidase family protein [Eggerthellaceae bacterium]|nr:metallopeptidase family protein [Eggerthellaceae bacterium]